MSTDLKVNPQSATERFQEHIRGKIREAIADALPVDVLDEMTAKSVKELFYTRKKAQRPHPNGRYGEREDYELPSFFESQILTLATPIIKAEIEKWMDANAQLLVTMWQKVFDDGVLTYIERLQAAKMQTDMGKVLTIMFAQLNEERRRDNRPEIQVPYF